MDEKSTTAPQDDPKDPSQANPTDPGTGATDKQTPDDGADLDSSKSTDKPTDDGDKTPEDGGKKGDTPAPKFDDDLDEWAEKTGRPKPETDRERELYQEIRNDRREKTREQQAKDSQKSVDKAIQDAKPDDNKQDDDDEDDPLAKEVAELKASNMEERNLRLRSEYFSANDVSEAEAKAMAEILQEKVDKGGQNAYDYWTNPDQLQDWHQLAKARLATTTDRAAIEEKAAQEERERIAKEHQASGGTRSAKVTQPAKPQGYNRTEYLKSDDD